MPSIMQNLQLAGDKLLVALSMSLIRKRRKASGQLINTMKHTVIKTALGYTLTIYMLDYWKWVNDGVSASNVPFGNKTGAKSSKYIKGLMKWIKIKGMASSIKHIRQLAFAIANTHKRTGIPVDKNKLGFVDDVMTESRVRQIQNRIVADTQLEINTELRKIIPKTFNVTK
jgi:hypothetical protein